MYVEALVKILYLVGALGIVWGLKYLSSPDTARKGNIVASIGMGLAIITSIFDPIENSYPNYLWIFVGIILGGIIGWYMAKKVQMTEMPQLVSLFNGFGGASAMILAIIELYGICLLYTSRCV